MYNNKLFLTFFIFTLFFIGIYSISIQIKNELEFKKEKTLIFKSYSKDHLNQDNQTNEKYQSIINHIEENGHIVKVFDENDNPEIQEFENDFILIGSNNLINNLSLLKKYIEKRQPIIFLNVNENDKKEFCNLVKNVCILKGEHIILGYIPKSMNSLKYHSVFNWMNGDNNMEETKVVSVGYDEKLKSVFSTNKTVETIVGDFDSDYKSMTNSLLLQLVGEVSGPTPSLVPPNNDTLPFAYFENTYPVSFQGAIYPAVASKVAQQTYSLSLTNHIYLYKDIPNNLIYAVVYQDGYLLPGGQLGINNPKVAIGSFTTSFGITNTLSFSDGQTPDGDSFNLEASSPQTVDQTHTITNEVSTEMSIGVSFDVNPDGGGGGASFQETWSSSSSETNTITDYGVNEMSNPVTMESSWMYHQQLPFDVYTWGYLNFGDWYQSAYSGNCEVAQPPPLSTSTLQTSTSWKWKFDTSLIDENGNLNVDLTTAFTLSYSMIGCPGFYTSHHKLFYCETGGSANQAYDFNGF
ncbi:hypothetical protein DDB_G0267564 [Dictyostelium discoideum AX4]|uniref:Uncharacterized protein n=1 Tax=Dictyostelium discoideum TaxID=44689 RepID=Q55GQ3_DICDI|nr:hypothetical protein DDB_G0267564 [Dictyostelium discoideum AX4]EAL73235.1 hypothetical protein DDB_G0267564 [Dictyostelium discoideum AX4]|eukprot:XP_647131.1 hypothetical protein DDB_G0267564 [Dictyostelium discoideum AX4]